ncbi:folate-binding protein YgfZ [Candidatus Pseudothioglobus singularis]|jgi:tRNA-modifying protein YgfZ|nr:folate-binding protein YgfZ [Candidatus Pseudothioglobus singularis]
MFCLLENRALLKISGSDAETFLHNQLTNDIFNLGTLSIQINAYCQHQGKILALLWVMRKDDAFLVSFPKDLINIIMPRLRMFVIMSEVIIEDISENFYQIGLIHEKHLDTFAINSDLSLLILDSVDSIQDQLNETQEWDLACINSLLPEVYSATSEKLVPQMLNLDINEIGVNFSKGCYPGQEVVARLHYLGSAKRRLFSFKSTQEMLVGDSLYCASSKAALVRGDRYKGSGIVVTKVKYNSLFYCLATLDLDLIDAEITLNNEHGPKLERINDE